MNVFSSAAIVQNTFFPHLTIQSKFFPCYSSCLLLLLFVCLICFLLEWKSHLLIILLLTFPSADTHTHPHNDAGSTTAYSQNFCSTLHLSHQTETLTYAIILRCTYILPTPCILPAETHWNFLAFPCCQKLTFTFSCLLWSPSMVGFSPADPNTSILCPHLIRCFGLNKNSWAEVCSPPQNYYLALSRSQKLHFIFPFFVFLFLY